MFSWRRTSPISSKPACIHGGTTSVDSATADVNSSANGRCFNIGSASLNLMMINTHNKHNAHKHSDKQSFKGDPEGISNSRLRLLAYTVCLIDLGNLRLGGWLSVDLCDC
jgi:hypothetical protein